MAPLSFAFGGTGNYKSAKDLQRERDIVDALIARSNPAPRTFGEGLTAIGEAIGTRMRGKRLERDTAYAQEGASSLAKSLFGGGAASMRQPTEDAYEPDQIETTDLGGVRPSKTTGNKSSALPASFLAAVDRTEGGGGYDTLYGHAQKKGQFAGLNVANMSVGDVMKFTDANGPYAQSVKSKLGYVATPVGRHQVVGRTLRNAIQNMGIDPATPFNQQTQDGIAMHLATQRVKSAPTLDGKIAALRQEWHGFKDIPNNEMAQIVADLEGGVAAPPVQVASNDQSFAPSQPQIQPASNVEMQQPQSGPTAEQLLGAMNDPSFQHLPEFQQKMIVDMYQKQTTPPDPMKALEMEKTRLELEAMRNPKLTPADTLAREKFEYEKAQKSGKWSKLSDGSLFNEATGEVKQVPNSAPAVDFKEVASLRKEIQDTPQIKNYSSAAPIYRSMVETAGRNSRASDLNLVYGVGKIMDPTSVVREGEMVMVKNTASLPDWVQGAIASLNGGAALTPETRKAIMAEAKSRMTAYANEASALRGQYEGIASRYKINMDDIWQELPKLPDYAPDITKGPRKTNSGVNWSID